MPRIDETTESVMRRLIIKYANEMPESNLLEALDTLIAIVNGKLEEDPGRYGPIDICDNHCHLFTDDLTEHPPYEDYNYSCFICGKDLTSQDD